MKQIISKSSFFALISVVFFAFSANANQESTVGVVNIDQISKEARVVKNIASQISKKRDRFQKEITKEESKLEKEKDKLDAKKNILSGSALKNEQKKFFRKVEKLKNSASKKDKILKKAYTESIKKVNDAVGEIVSEIALERNLSIVLPSSQVVFSIKGVDITSAVVAKLDKKITKIRVDFD